MVLVIDYVTNTCWLIHTATYISQAYQWPLLLTMPRLSYIVGVIRRYCY